MSHFADADGERASPALERFAALAGDWRGRSAWPIRRPSPSSGHSPRLGEPGIMLYGPAPLPTRAPPTRPQAGNDLDQPHHRRPGHRCRRAGGYGGTFTADRPTRVGIVACSCADGYPATPAAARRSPYTAGAPAPGPGVDGHGGLRPDRSAAAGLVRWSPCG